MNQKSLSVWKGVWALIRFRPGFFAINVIFVTTFIASRLVPGWIEKLFYDQLTGGVNTATSTGLSASVSLWGILGILVAVEVARFSTNAVGEWGGMRMRNANGSLMRKNIVEAILRKPGAQPLPVPAGDITNRLNNDIADYADFPTWTPEVIGHMLFTVIAFVVMLRISPLITLVALVPLVGVFFLNKFAWQRFLSYGHESRSADSKVTGFLGEIFGAVQAVKVANAEKGTIGYFHQLNETRRQATVRYHMFWAMFQAANDHLGDIAVAVMVLLAGVAIRSGDFTIGDFALFSTYLFFAARFPATVGSFISETAQQRVVLDRVQQIIPNTPPEALVAHGEIYERSHREVANEKPVVPFVQKTAVFELTRLDVKGLSYQFQNNSQQSTGNGQRATDNGIFDITFSLPRGSFTVVTGQVGSGKTTLLRVLLGLLPLDSGGIRWNDEQVSHPATFFVPPRTAYTPQVPRLFSESLRDNVLMGLPDINGDLDNAVFNAVLEQDIGTLENGLDTIVGPRGVRLSGGQVQRSAAARMFVRNAELLVFDDLSSALDVETERVLWERLFDDRDMAHHTPTCLVVSHRKEALRRADQILVMKNGRIDAIGTLNELLTTSAEMQAIWRGQDRQEGELNETKTHAK